MRVVVAGSGVVGASVAFHLADAGVEVVVADDDRRGRATLAGAGIVAPPGHVLEGGTLDDDLRFELRLAAFAAYPALLERIGLGGATHAFATVGQLHVAPPGPLLDGVAERLLALEGDGTYPPGTVRPL
ncbi:MAG TPA: FAD-dependent oxidoreductase, partial [Acidimicrobiales bacterium]|nr:FAD-dependent oxidoreductase [Acidimicrobiales bacterium]